MTKEDMDKAVETLLNKIKENPADTEALEAQLAAKISEYHDLGLPVPSSITKLEAALDDTDEEDEWDNMPV